MKKHPQSDPCAPRFRVGRPYPLEIREFAELRKAQKEGTLQQFADTRFITIAQAEAMLRRLELQTAKFKRRVAQAAAERSGRQVMVVRGVCRYCACTDDRACDGGCAWVDAAHTVCSNADCVQRAMADGLQRAA